MSTGDSNPLVGQSYDQGYPHILPGAHNVPGQEGRGTIISINHMVDSDPFQGFFPSAVAQAILSSELHTPPRANDVLAPEGCQMYLKLSTRHNRTVPCGWKDERGHACGTEVTFDCQDHFAIAHGITKLSARIQVTCKWCGSGKKVTRGCLVRHIREAHLRVGRLKKAHTS